MNYPFLKLVAEDIKTRFGQDLSDIAIVFNNKRPITYLKKHLAETFGKAIWSPQFFTIQEFLNLSNQKEQASQLSQFFYLYELHNAMLIEEGIEPETLEEFYPIAEIILNDFSQLDYELVSIEEIYMELFDTTIIDIEFQHLTTEQQEYIRQFWQSFSIAGHSAVQERFLKLWKRLPRLYKAFKDKLASLQQTNYPTLYRDIIDGNMEYPEFASPFKKILFVGFNALNKVEAQLFKQWQDEDLALFYFDADDYYLSDNQQEAGLFIRRNILQTGLDNALGDVPNIIGNRIYSQNKPNEHIVHLYASTGKVSQTKLLHDILLATEKQGKSSAILLADEGLLVPLLQSLPDMKVNITTGFPLIQSPIYGVLDLWMNVHEEISYLKKSKISYQALDTFLNNPLTRTDTEEKKYNQDRIAEKQLFEISLSEIKIKTSVLPQFFEPLKTDSDITIPLIDIIDQLLTANNDDTHIKQIDATLLIELKKVLNQLHIGFSKLPKLSIGFQLGLIRKAISPINSAIEGDPLDGLQIMGILESRCLNFDHIYILGANEGILPKTSSGTTFLPNNLRKAYGLPILENQDALSAYLFYRHFQYSQEIHLFYNSIVDESSSGEESRFIKQLEFESPLHFKKLVQQQPIHFPKASEELTVQKNGKVWEKLYKNFITDKQRFSATALTTYLQSPLQFFFKYVAAIKEPPSISQEFEMNKLGTVVHNVMENLLMPYKGIDTFTPTKKLLDKLPLVSSYVIQEIGKEYAQEFKTIDELNALQRIMHKIASEYVTMYLRYDSEQYKAFKIIELENDKDYNLHFPIQVNGQTEQINIYGIIDRVDEVMTLQGDIKTRIVDYKTGGDSVSFTNMDKVLSTNTSNKALVQTLFYSYVFEQVTGRKALEPHLYVARKMREEGTLFAGSYGKVMEKEFLMEQKEKFVDFLRSTLEEIFDSSIPFKHDPDAIVYSSDPYTLFYRNSVTDDEGDSAF